MGMSKSQQSNKNRSNRGLYFAVLIALIALLIGLTVPDLTHNKGDITIIERIVNFFVWIPVTIDHFIYCTLLGNMYYSVDFNENPYSVAEPALYIAEKVRLMMHESDSYHNENPTRVYDMPSIDASEIPLDNEEEAMKKFEELTNNYFHPFIIRNFANKATLRKWKLFNLGTNYSNENVTKRQWEGGCELGHIDATYRKTLSCEKMNENLKDTIFNMVYKKDKWGMAHTIIPKNTEFQSNIFKDFKIDQVFKLFSFFQTSELRQKITKYLLDRIPQSWDMTRKMIQINVFDEMTALFLQPTYWDDSAVRYKPETEELLSSYGMQDGTEFRRRQGAQLHNAFLGNIFVNVEGRKTWQFISPEYTIYLRPICTSYGFATFSFIQYYLFKDYFGYNGTNITNLEKFYNKNENDYNWFKNNKFNEEYDIVDPKGSYEKLQKFSSFEHMKQVYESIPKYEIMVEEGDLVFFPPFWWHGVKNYETKHKDEFDYAQPVNFAVANRLIFGLKAFQLNYYDWLHSIFLFSFKHVKMALYGVEVRMHNEEN